MAAQATDVPPLPPIASTPSKRPAAWSFGKSTAAPRLIAATASPRSCFALKAAKSTPAARATSSRVMSGSIAAGPSTPTSIINALCPRPSTQLLMKPYSAPFVSKAPNNTIVLAINKNSSASLMLRD